MGLLVVFAVPWFLWRNNTVVGLPLWLWWHVGWMVLASGVFALFARRAWGIGIESQTDERSGADAARGDRV